MASITHVVLVGQCGPDNFDLRLAVQRALPDVQIESADDADELAPFLSGDSLLLVNRELMRGLGTPSGTELIRQLSARPAPPRLMLISDFADAQDKAVAAGARPGFGKAQLDDDIATQRLRDAVAD